MRVSHSVRTSSPLVVAFLALAACGAAAGTASSDTTATTNVTQAVATVDTRLDVTTVPPHGGHPGPDFLVFAALHEPIGLTEDQTKTIQALVASGARPFDKTRAAALAAGIRAGQVVVESTAPTEDEIAAHRATAANALATLHAALTASQRRALVDAIKSKESEHASNANDVPHDGPIAYGGRGPVEHLLEGLDLSAAQQQEITTKLDATCPTPPTDGERAARRAEHESMHAAMQAKLETFADETFDAVAFVTPRAGATKAGGDHPDRFAADLAIVTSVLDAAQREKLAQRIEAGPPAHLAPPR